MRFIRHIFTASLLTIAVVAVANIQEPGLRGLEGNAEYMELKHKKAEILGRVDSLQQLVNLARQNMRQPDSLQYELPILDTLGTYILDIEQQIFDLRNEHGVVIARINAIEQEWLIEQMFSDNSDFNTDDTTPSANEELTDSIENDAVEPIIPVEPATLIESHYLVDNLSAEDIEHLTSAIEEEQQLKAMAVEYTETYEQMRRTASEYRTTGIERVADSLFAKFAQLSEQAEELSLNIDRSWVRVLDTKYYSYGYVLERERRYELLDSIENNFATMFQQCAAEDGIYASDALMHYAIGYPTLLDYEITFATEIGHNAIADTLRCQLDSLQLPEYRIDPITLERRLFIDYTPITIGRTNFYNSNNPLPELKVYERGTIYRILLGEFRNRQPMTLFKGVQPLYIEENEEGNYVYYTGGFETRTEADEAQLFLRERGFRNPEICRWRDGQMVNLSQLNQEDSVDSSATIIAGNRFIVIISTEILSDEVRATIQSAAPDKMITRSGDRFVVGTFTERSDADMVLSTLADTHPELSVSISQIEL